MRKKNILFITGIIFLMLISFASADWTPQSDIDLRNVYEIKNVTNITAQYYCNATACFTVTELYSDGTVEGDLNVNSSDYWDDMDSINATQMENSGGYLNILVSWLTGFLGYTKSEVYNKTETYSRSEVDNNFTLYLLLTDQRFNETTLLNSINTTANIKSLSFYDKAEVDNNFSLYYLKTEVDNNLSLYLLLTDQRFNDTALINAVNTSANIKGLGFYDKTEVDNNFTLYYTKIETDNNFSLYYTKIEVDNNFSLYYTKTEVDNNLSNYILTASEGNLNVNQSDYWDDMGTINATQMEDNGGTLNIIVSWLTGLFISDSDEGDLNVNSSDYWDDFDVPTDLNQRLTLSQANITDEDWIEDSELPLENKTISHCSNVTGATSNLCTITDTNDSAALNDLNTTLGVQLLVNNSINKSSYWDDMGTINATQMEDSGGYLNILVSWLTSLFYTEAEVDALNNTMGTYVNTQDVIYNTSATDYTDSKLITNFINASVVLAVTGNAQGAVADLQSYDGISYNLTEVSSDMELRVNFTGITSFNQLLVRYKAAATEGHTMVIQLWDYTDSAWESYRTVGHSEDYSMMTMGVYDESDHISGGIVQVRFYSNNPGGSTHKHQFDWVEISDGPATPSSDETDPFSIHTDGMVSFTANWNQGAWNLTNPDSWFNGSINGSNVQNENWIEDSQEGDLNVNSSDYWDNYGTANQTQMENSGGVLNILVSWLTGLFYTKAEVDNNLSLYILDSSLPLENQTISHCSNITGNATDLCTITPGGGFTTDQNDRLNTTGDPIFENVTIGLSDGDNCIYFYRGVGNESLCWNNANTRFLFSDQVTAGQIVATAGMTTTTLSASQDIYTTSSNDDLWLGSGTQANALFQAWADGRVNGTNITANEFFFGDASKVFNTNLSSVHFDASTTANITCMNTACDWFTNATDSCMYWPSGGKDCGA